MDFRKAHNNNAKALIPEKIIGELIITFLHESKVFLFLLT